MFDAHCHLQFAAFDHDREALLEQAFAQGLHGLVLAGFDSERRQLAAQLASKHPQVFASAGLHPWAIEQDPKLAQAWLDSALKRLASDLQAHQGAFCALGECGLDYKRAKTPAQRQVHQRAFVAQLKLASDLKLPVILHIVRAYHDLLPCIEEASHLRGMVHSFSGSMDLVEPLVQRGLVLSFGTDLVRHKPGKVHRVFKHVVKNYPEHWTLETDAPDRAVGGQERGTPLDLVVVLQTAAELSGAAVDKMARMSEANARRCLGLPQAVEHK